MTVEAKVEEALFAPPPRGFRIQQDGVWFEVRKSEGAAEWQRLCSPIRVLALTRDGAGRGWGRLVEVIDQDGRVHRQVLPARLFAGDGLELRAVLLDMGLVPSNARGARSALVALLQGWLPPMRALTASQLGWVGEGFEAFLLGNGRVIGACPVVFDGDGVPGAAAEMRPAGSLEDWRSKVAAPCVGNPLMLVAVSLALAGPLLEPLGMDGGGIHLRGASSRGKSTIQRVAVSVWGSPRFLFSWRATANGLEGVAAIGNGTLLALDEIGEVTGREAGQAAYMLANGQGKTRATRQGLARPALRWRTMLLSSGELTLADKMAEAGGKAAAGQAVRLLDIAADQRAYGAFDDLHGVPDPASFAARLREATTAHFGTAGPALVEALIELGEVAVERVRDAMAGFRDRARRDYGLDGEGQVERALTRFALIAAAGELATHFGITGWPEGAVRDAALDVFGLWLAGRGGTGPQEARQAVQRVRTTIMAHGSSRFETLGETGLRPIIDRAGWRKENSFYIAEDAWQEIHRGADPREAARHLFEAGYLNRPEDGRWKTRLPVANAEGSRPRAYQISAAILEHDDV